MSMGLVYPAGLKRRWPEHERLIDLEDFGAYGVKFWQGVGFGFLCYQDCR